MSAESVNGDHDLIEKTLKELHASYMKNNAHDEGDIIYHRINYRIANTFGITKEEAARLHSEYHSAKPRKVSEGFCEKCNMVVTIIPVIYGIQESDMERLKTAEMQGRLIIGEIDTVRQGSEVAMFGCSECKSMMPKYGML